MNRHYCGFSQRGFSCLSQLLPHIRYYGTESYDELAELFPSGSPPADACG